VGALRHAINMAWGAGAPNGASQRSTTSVVDIGIVCGSAAVLVLLGLWMPDPLVRTLEAAARIVRGTE